MRHKEWKEVINNYRNSTEAELVDFADEVGRTVDDVKELIENYCYNISSLSFKSMKKLRKEIDEMTSDEIAIVERANGTTIDNVIECMDDIINDWKQEKKLQKKHSRLVEEKFNELVDNGVIGTVEGDTVTLNDDDVKVFLQLNIDIAKEIGLHIEIDNPLIGHVTT